jgi:hypothetical protein
MFDKFSWPQRIVALCAIAALALIGTKPVHAQAGGAMTAEAAALLAREADESHRPAYTPATGVAFKASDHVFLRSALAIDFTYRKASVTLPIFRGVQGDGKIVYYIITEASDFDVARQMGVNFSPKMTKAAGTAGAQNVTLVNGIMHFPGNVDFSPVFKVVAGPPPTYFPPKVANPGGIADAKWSPIVVLPSGLVLNAQQVHNPTGSHKRVKSLDLARRTVTLSILDGVQGGRQYYYHLVTDASAAIAAVLEKGVYAPRLGKVPAFGESLPSDNSALLGFSPVLNGNTVEGSGDDQGFSTALHNGVDPINVFPIPPDNEDSTNNYSPLWDAHVSQWTAKAIQEGKVHRIHSMAEQKQLIAEGYLTSAYINPPGPGNPYVGGLRPTHAIIDCPVIAQPDLPAQ